MFITEALLTTLMCAPRSVYSWDVVATRSGGQLFFDRHDGSEVELLTAAETAPEAVAEDRDALNGVQQLSQEATAVNQNFCQQARAPARPGRPVRPCAPPRPAQGASAQSYPDPDPKPRPLLEAYPLTPCRACRCGARRCCCMVRRALWATRPTLSRRTVTSSWRPWPTGAPSGRLCAARCSAAGAVSCRAPRALGAAVCASSGADSIVTAPLLMMHHFDPGSPRLGSSRARTVSGLGRCMRRARFFRARPRYRKFKIGEDLALVVRCELDGLMTYKGQELLLSIKALNEFDPKITGAAPSSGLCGTHLCGTCRSSGRTCCP